MSNDADVRPSSQANGVVMAMVQHGCQRFLVPSDLCSEIAAQRLCSGHTFNVMRPSCIRIG